jgi:Reverse transcriptase (RNA-dependent DNA polymerase)
LEELPGFYSAFTASLEHNCTNHHCTDLPEPPKFWKDVATHPHKAGFKAAANKEYRDLERRGTFKPVPESEAGKAFIIPTMWVFTYKFDSNNILIKYKARLVVRGDLQRNSKFQDNYAATLAARIFQALMAIAAYFDLEMRHFDAVNAFTNSGIDEDIYIRFPKGYERLRMCLKLLQTLYGLPRSSLLWLKEFCSKLKELGIEQSLECQCLFFSSKLIIFFYVDDIAILYHRQDTEEYELFREKLLDAYEMREMGELQWFLGIRIVRDRMKRKIWLCQDSNIESMMDSFNLYTSKYPNTPMLTDELKLYSGQATPQEVYSY